MDRKIVIKVEAVEKAYPTGEGDSISVLNGVDTEILESDFAIIYGPSGSGKSTLLHHMVGLEKPTKGKIVVNGVDITKLNSEERAIFRAKNIGMVYQFWYWAKSLNVLENVAMPLYIAGELESIAKKKAMSVLEEINMEKYAYKRPMQLSGGEQQRVGLARALVNDPEIIIADEPTGNLDTHNSDFVMQFLQFLSTKKRRTIVMVTHNLIYLPLATKTIAMRDGKVISGGETAVREQIKEELKGVL